MAKRLFKKCLLCICILSMSILSVSLNVYADKQTDTSKGSVSLTGVLSDAEFYMYDVDVEMRGLDSVELRNLANTLEIEMKLKGTEPLSAKTSDKNGMVKWENVPEGTYLITGEAVVRNGVLYTPAPILVEIKDNEIIIEVKYSKQKIGEKITINVVKVWDDEGNEENRPEEVVVWLLRNNAVYKKIELNRDNNWIYTWSGLDSGSVWKVIEADVPEGYTMSMEEDAYEFVITNSYEESTTPDDGTTTPDDGKDVNISDNKTGEQGDAGGTGAQKLPQSGQVWWPVPVLMAAGILFFLIGWRKRKEN